MSDLVKFSLPADFVNDKAILRPSELRYGWEHSWLSSADVVSVALYGFEHRSQVPAYEEIALLLSDERGRIPDLIRELDTADAESNGASGIWLYLSLAWLYENRGDFADPLQVVEMIYADFGYPEEMTGFVRFLPPPPDADVGVDAVYDRWRAYLARKASVYRTRKS